jgi:hypothetical protein
LTDLIQLVLWGLTAVIFVAGLWLPRRAANAPETVNQMRGQEVNTAQARGGGSLAVGKVETLILTPANVEALWQQIGQSRPSPDLRRATAQYLTYMVDRYQYLDFKGMGVSDRIALQMPLVEMYVPLKARIEMPEGETWRRLRLAGRPVSEAEAEGLGAYLSEPQPLLTLLQNHNG